MKNIVHEPIVAGITQKTVSHPNKIALTRVRKDAIGRERATIKKYKSKNKLRLLLFKPVILDGP